MAQISEKAEKAIKTLLESWWAAVNEQIDAATGAAVRIGEAPMDILFASEVGQRMVRIAQAAEGLLEWDPDTAWRIFEDCNDTEKWLTKTPIIQKTPQEFWSTPVGFMLLCARVWAEHDRLISLREASEMSGLSLSALSQQISRGKIHGYLDPEEPNPQHARRILLSEASQLAGKTKSEIHTPRTMFSKWNSMAAPVGVAESEGTGRNRHENLVLEEVKR